MMGGRALRAVRAKYFDVSLSAIIYLLITDIHAIYQAFATQMRLFDKIVMHSLWV